MDGCWLGGVEEGECREAVDLVSFLLKPMLEMTSEWRWDQADKSMGLVPPSWGLYPR